MKKNKTKQMLKLLLILASLFSLTFVPWTLVKAWGKPLPDTVQEQLDEAMGYDFEGMIVYIDKAGQESQSFASGWHNRESKIPAKTDALYKIASISKLYDAVAVTKLVSQGRLSLDKTLAEYLPELDGEIENADKITLRLMIQHKSGIPNFTDTPKFWENPVRTYDENLALIKGKPANFEPGEDYEYCNTNYLLINRIMDNELGFNNFQFIKKEILSPLGLKNTYSSLKEVNIENVMSGYHIGYPYDVKENDYGMHASAQDVGVFLRALNNGAVFDEGQLEIYASIYEFEHDGWVPGYQSFAKYHKDIDAVIITFYNTTDPKLYNWNLSEIINKRVYKIIKKQK